VAFGGEVSSAAPRTRAEDSFGAEATAADTVSGAAAEALTDEQQFVVSTLRNLLGVAAVAADDDFFQLGAESLSGIQLLARIRAQYGVDFELKNLLQ
jgi:acyl carrier protein